MRSKFLVGMVFAMAVFSLAGCGVKEKMEMKTDKVSVSENSGRTLEERKEALFKADIEGEALEMTLSKNYLYSSNHDGYITQWNRKGEKVSSTRKEEYTVNACSDKRLICSKWTTDEEELFELYSIPIKQTESGEDVLWDKAEKVVSYDTDDADILYLCEPYLIYTEDDITLTRLNLETKEKKTLKFDGVEWIDNASLIDGLLYLVERGYQGKNVYCIRIDDWTSEKLYENKTEGEIYDIHINGQYLYVSTDNLDVEVEKIECYDMEQKKVLGRISIDEIDTLLLKEGLIANSVLSDADDSIDGCWMYAYKGRLYLSMFLEGQQIDGRFVLLSCSMEDMADLRYEREISEWWYENTTVYEDEEGKEYSGYFWEAYEDVFYFTYMDKKDKKERLMRCHLDTKKWEEVPENDLHYLAYREMGRAE